MSRKIGKPMYVCKMCKKTVWGSDLSEQEARQLLTDKINESAAVHKYSLHECTPSHAGVAELFGMLWIVEKDLSNKENNNDSTKFANS